MKHSFIKVFLLAFVLILSSCNTAKKAAEAEAEYGLSLRIGVLCNNAFFMNQPLKQKDIKVNGSPTEKALLLAGWQAGLDKEKIDKKYQRLDEVPFDSKNKYIK